MKHRPFRLTDAMILVIAAAVGLSVNRLNWPGFLDRWWQPLDAHDSIERVLDLLMPHIAAVTVAALLMRMRYPRPPYSQLSRQPGTVACAVALVVLLVIACWAGITTATGRVFEFSEHVIAPGPHTSGGFVPLNPYNARFLVACGDRIGFAVAGAWLSLWLSRRWRPEKTWIDRFGRSLGWLWLIVTSVLWLRCYNPNLILRDERTG